MRLRGLCAGRANEAASGLEELKALDVIVTGLQLERLIERGQAVAADVAARYGAAQQADATALAPVKRKKVTAAASPCLTMHCLCFLDHQLRTGLVAGLCTP